MLTYTPATSNANVFQCKSPNTSPLAYFSCFDWENEDFKGDFSWGFT